MPQNDERTVFIGGYYPVVIECIGIIEIIGFTRCEDFHNITV
ncbi:hypothetical protein Barb4_02139 [Bacteroidales bacterium Barb4]|nr:hypothetical protein Barb4_02139 [Bacteroidales bacterium Barb4]